MQPLGSVRGSVGTWQDAVVDILRSPVRAPAHVINERFRGQRWDLVIGEDGEKVPPESPPWPSNIPNSLWGSPRQPRV